ncbi:MAG TPA: SH3 domain-containing protein [Steroidobacteraceae bacterium]|nr:SH3 domain-containing protein [Steroidobacteraceae bacterium]
MTTKPPKESDNSPQNRADNAKAREVLKETRPEDSTARALARSLRVDDSTQAAFAALLQSPMNDAIRKLHEENEKLTKAFRFPLADKIEKLRINVPQFPDLRLPSVPELPRLSEASANIARQIAEMTRASQATSDLLRSFRKTYTPPTFEFAITKQIAGLAADLAEQSRVSRFGDIFKATRQAAEVARHRLDALQASIDKVTSSPLPSETAGVVIDVDAAAMSISGQSVGLDVSEWNSIPDNEKSLHKLPLATQLFIVLFFLLILRPILDRLVADYFLGETKTRDVTNVVIEVQQVFGSENFEFLRCVRATSLNVREAPDAESKIIGRLNRGQIVEVVTHKGVWTYVQYAERNSDEAKTGWVATAYLSRELCLSPTGKG